MELWECLEDFDLFLAIRFEGVILDLLGAEETFLLWRIVPFWGAVIKENAETDYEVGP